MTWLIIFCSYYLGIETKISLHPVQSSQQLNSSCKINAFGIVLFLLNIFDLCPMFLMMISSEEKKEIISRAGVFEWNEVVAYASPSVTFAVELNPRWHSPDFPKQHRTSPGGGCKGLRAQSSKAWIIFGLPTDIVRNSLCDGLQNDILPRLFIISTAAHLNIPLTIDHF